MTPRCDLGELRLGCQLVSPIITDDRVEVGTAELFSQRQYEYFYLNEVRSS